MLELPTFRSSINGFNRTDVIEYVKEMLDENALLASQLRQAQEEITSMQAEIEEYQKQISDQQTQKQNEQVLGRVMYDARRFSDTLVQEANDKANDMLDNAAQTAEEIAQNVDEIAQQADNLSAFFMDAMEEINAQFTGLTDTLRNFNKEVLDKKTLEVPLDPPLEVAMEELQEIKEETAQEIPQGTSIEELQEPMPKAQQEPAPARVTIRRVKRPDGNKQ